MIVTEVLVLLAVAGIGATLYRMCQRLEEAEESVAPGQMTIFDDQSVVNADDADDDQDSIV